MSSLHRVKEILIRYRIALFLGFILSLCGVLYLFIASPYIPLNLSAAPYLFYAVFLITLVLTYEYVQRAKGQHDLLIALTLSFLPLAGIGVTVTHLLDAVVPPLIYGSTLLGLVFFGVLVIRTVMLRTQFTPLTAYGLDPHAAAGYSPMSARFIVTVIAIAFAGFGVWQIGAQTLVDEPLWVFDRVEQYWHNAATGDLRHTRSSDKPGVTVALLSGVSLFAYPTPSAMKDAITPEVRTDLLTWMRVPLVLAVALLMPLFYMLTRMLFGTMPALYATTITAFSPLLLGITRMINPDALLWMFIPLTLLAFTAAIMRGSNRLTILAGTLLGLAILTKYVANVLFVFLPMMIILLIMLRKHNAKENVRIALRGNFLAFLSTAMIAVLTYSILLPSTWVHPLHILEGTLWSQAFGPLWRPFIIIILAIYADLFVLKRSFLSRFVFILSRYRTVVVATLSIGMFAAIIFTLVSAHMHAPFDYQTALTSPKSAIKNVGELATFFADFYTLIFGVHIVALLGAGIVFLIAPFFRKDTTTHIVLALSLFIPFYYIGSTFGGVAATMRYQIALYPILFIAAAYGLNLLFTRTHHAVQKLFFIGIFTASLFTLAAAMPYYQSYANELLPRGDILNIKDMGDGSYQAAQYLNALPQAEKLSIWADKSGVCAAFIGSCTTTIDVARVAREHLDFDYYVISRGRENLTVREAQRRLRRKDVPQDPLLFAKLYQSTVPSVYMILLDHRGDNDIRVISAQQIDIHRSAQ